MKSSRIVALCAIVAGGLSQGCNARPCGASTPPTVPAGPGVVEVDATPEPTSTAAAPPPRYSRACRLRSESWRPSRSELPPEIWVDGLEHALTYFWQGSSVTAVLEPQASRIDVTISFGGFELRGWATPASLPIYLRAPRPIAGVIEPHPTTPVSFRGFEGGDVMVGYAIGEGVVPDVLEFGLSCEELTLDRPPWKAVSWDHSRAVVTTKYFMQVPLSLEPRGPVVLEIDRGLFEVVDQRDPFTKIRWVRPRETVVGWVPSRFLESDNRVPNPVEPPLEREEGESFMPSSPWEPRQCSHDVPLYLLLSSREDGEEGRRAIVVGRIRAKSPFEAVEEAPPDPSIPRKMLYVQDSLLTVKAGTVDRAFAVATADLKDCTTPSPF